MAGVSAAPGVLLVDKPPGLTSHDVVARLRRYYSTRRVGHAGTLDPMATGLLLVGVESATRLLAHLVGLGKEYSATIRLGQSSSTDDAEGAVEAVADATGLGDDAIAAAIARLTGTIRQVPSSVSAIKVAGVRAYQRAREGEVFELEAREVTVSRFELLARRSGPTGCLDLDVEVEVSSGSYVRALARDLGADLGVGGHLTALRRRSVGPFRVDDAWRMDPARLDAVRPDDAELAAAFRSPAQVAAALYPVERIDAAQLRDLAHGKPLALDRADAPVLALLGPDGRLAGLVELVGGRSRVLYNPPTQEVLG